MDPIHVQAFVHELLPEVEAVIGRVYYLLLKANEELLKVIDLHNIDCLLVGEKGLILTVHDVLHTLFRLI